MITRYGWKSALMLALAAAALLGLPRCQTGNSAPEPASADEPIVLEPVAMFHPESATAPIKALSGPYPNLYDRASFAVWVDKRVADAKRAQAMQEGEPVPEPLALDAQTIVENFIVVECHMKSAFGDMAIAYDAVRFRGIEAYLELPSGETIPPIQQITGRQTEENAGALKSFERINVLVFPGRDIWQGGATVGRNAPSARLILEGQATTFAFAWENLAATPNPDPIVDLDAVKVGFTDLFQALRALSHVFD